MLRLRAASPDDLPALRTLIAESVRALSIGFYDDAQRESGLRHVFGVDSQLIADGTYFVFVDDLGALAAAGGWSRRRTLYGGDQAKSGPDDLLDPAREPARIRAFFVHPDFARRGLARRLFTHCRDCARAEGFTALELMATLPGVPLYTALGFTPMVHEDAVLPDGVVLPMVQMRVAVD
ncbi:MAG: GNAT family N-acetyltransferase [Gemmatimonadaceae bacterium]|nr:GNAT family N-acetyltransferase [Gemmatimonadaceae bacterium]